MQKDLLTLPSYSGVNLTPDSFIQCQIWTSVAPFILAIQGTAYNADGKIVRFDERREITSVSVQNIVKFRLGYYSLLSLVVSCENQSVGDGQAYGLITLSDQSPNTVNPYRKVLAQGFLSDGQALSFGESSSPVTGASHIFTDILTLPDPSAGNPITYTLPPWYHIKLKHLTFQLDSDVNVANRFVYVEIQPVGGYLHRVYCITPQPDSRAVLYYGYPLAVETYNTGNGTFIFNLPELTLKYGDVINIGCLNIQSGDQFTLGTLICENQIKPS